MAQNPTISKMETTQTAVEWLIEQVNSEQYQIAFGQTYISIDLIEQAKQMERQQLANSWDKACEQYIYRDGNLVKVWKDFDKYYNDNYGSDNQI